MRHRVLAACLLGISSVTLAADGETEKKPSAPIEKKMPAATERKPVDFKGRKTGDPEFITKGIAELKAQMEAAIKDPASASIPEKAEYFATNTEPVVEADLIRILGRRFDRNPAIDAYIKWQLLSLQPATFSDENFKAAFKLYVNAFVPPPRPGTGNDSQMLTMIRQVNKENLNEANTAWESKIAAHDAAVAPIFRYRDELYAKLPKNFDVIHAGFNDAEMRMRGGYDTRDILTRVSKDLRGLAAGSKPAEIANMVKLAQYYAGREGSLSYDGLAEDKGKIKWRTSKRNFDKKQLDQLAKDLEETAKIGF